MPSLLENFRDLHTDYAPIPFYWWAGEPLSRDRISWQLDQLRAQGVRATIISYPHDAQGLVVAGEPPLFSHAWWDFFRWFLEACREREMAAGIQDYNIVAPALQEIGRSTPGMQGGRMACVAHISSTAEQVVLEAEPGTSAILAWAYLLDETSTAESKTFDLTPLLQHDAIHWTAPAGKWLVALVFVQPNAFDPLHPDSGRLAIEQLYAPFERQCPGAVGTTLKFFFQDELDFGSRMPFWSNRLFTEFLRRKNYDLRPWLPALWHDLGKRSEKVRLDYQDVVVACLEEAYFKPIFAWHEERGTFFANDNCGRGDIRVGRQYYGDYFRTMRWYTAPGTDDPHLEGPRAFRALKVNSSIAHLYQRRRVWVEAFHSSGWGVTPAELVAALGEDFAYGATVVNLHGLYYTTRGSWWEWASPDFHFRQPYWQDCHGLNHYLGRLSWLLSQGIHCCDVAILYPIDSLSAERFGAPGLDSEQTALSLGKFLFDHACDFDFIDFESLERARFAPGRVTVGDASYQALILPAMAAVHFSTLVKAHDFIQNGGVVIAYGRLPEASDLSGRDDPQLQSLLVEIFGVSSPFPSSSAKLHPSGGRGIYIPEQHAAVLQELNAGIQRTVLTSTAPLQVLHRRIGRQDLVYLFNPAPVATTGDLQLRAGGKVEEWNAWTGDAAEITAKVRNPGETIIPVSLAAKEARLIMLSSESPPSDPGSTQTRVDHSDMELIRLDGPWEFSLQPTLDNRFGDFRLPASHDCLGPEALRFRYADEVEPNESWHEPAFDDSTWPETTFSFGPRFLSLGPLPPETDFVQLEKRLLSVDDAQDAWQPYPFSLQWGIERDPYLTNFLSGPHGLKNQVPDEFLDFFHPIEGTAWYLRAQVVAPNDGEVPLVMGGRCAYAAWVNGRPVVEQRHAQSPGLHPPWDIPHYDSIPRESRAFLHRGVNHLLLKLVQPRGQRTRAYIAFRPPPRNPDLLALRWFTDPLALRPCWPAPQDRRAVWLRFLAPPGLRELELTARGSSRVWSNGVELETTQLGPRADGAYCCRAAVGDPSPAPVKVAIRVEAPREFRAGDVLPAPVRLTCGPGSLCAGDWSTQGLAVYSGRAVYKKTFNWDPSRAAGNLILDLGQIFATAEVRINGVLAGTLITPPWQMDISDLVRSGENEISVRVANTLANHYNVAIPSPYAIPARTQSGLIGPIRLLQRQS